MDQDIIRETQAWKALSAFLVTQPACTNDHLARLTAAGAIQALDMAGLQIVPKPILGLDIVLDEEGEREVMAATALPETGYAKAIRLIREGIAWPGAITRALGGASANGPEGNVWALFSERTRTVGPDAEPEDAPKDNWGLCPRSADDLAQRAGCRVDISGKDDPAEPDTYYDDLTSYAVVTERTTGRLVGLVECWDTEDGDPIVPRTWLKAVLLEWRANTAPKRAA